MAYQKKTWTNDVSELSAENFNPMEEGIFGAYPVQLIAIDSTAPSTCSTGDKYYNTTSKKIFTATGTNTWGTNGETPLEDTAYWLISENGSYAWNGTDLVSIGGGKAEVVISDEEPEEGKLWVNPEEEIPVIAGREHLVQVSNEVDEDYRVNFLKGKNLFNKDNANEQSLYFSSDKLLTDNSNNSKSIYIPIKPNTTYTISKTAGKTFRIATTSSIPSNNVSTISSQANHEGTSITITTEANAKYLWVNYFNTQNGDTGTASDMMATLQIEQGSSATSYEPYVTPSIYVDGEEIYSKMKVYTDTYATYFKFDKMVCCVVNRQAQTTDGTVATIPSEFACANDMRNVINYYNGSSYVSGILWSQNVGLYIRDMYGNIPSNASFIRGMLIWEAKN